MPAFLASDRVAHLLSRLLPHRRHGAFVFAAVAAMATLRAQCDAAWQHGAPAQGPNGTIRALLPLPNGEMLAAGSFRIADSAVVNNIARWDGLTWHALGAGTSGPIYCLAQLPNGDVIAGGSFTSAGGQPSGSVARWDGQAWTSLGAGPGSVVFALQIAANGTIIAGGNFASGLLPAVMEWNGSAWSPLSGASPTGGARALAWLPNGDLVAGGAFYGGGTPYYGLQRWNGTSWQAIPGFDTTVSSVVDDLVVRPNGDLVIVGTFQINGVPETCAVWNGTAMQGVTTPPITGSPRALALAVNGDVLLGGSGSPNLARWNGATWQTIAGTSGTISKLAEVAAGNVLAGFTFSLGVSVRRFDGTAWHDLGAGPPPSIQTMTRLPNGDVVVGGIFSSIEGTSASRVARWNGTAWSPLGLGVSGLVYAITGAPNGDVIVGGVLTAAGGAPVANIARWDGQTWSTLGAGLPLPNSILIRSVAVAGNGDVLALTNNNVLFRFDGLQWQQVASPAAIVFAMDLLALANGDVLVGGLFSLPGSSVGLMRYSAGTLTPVSGAPSLVANLAPTNDGAVLVHGSNSLWSWDGSNWSALPNVAASHFAQLANGEIVACGTQQALGGADPSALFRLRANGWESWGAITGSSGGSATSLATTPRGEVLVGGTFQTAGDVVCCNLARSSPTCPATTAVFGSGCSGSAGPVTLSVTNGAWVGGTMRATAHTFPAGSLALQVLGVQNMVTPLPGGAPGCSLYVQPILTDVLVPSGGAAACAFAIPAQPALVGLQFRMQVVGIELAGGSIVRLTGTNALDVTIGAL